MANCIIKKYLVIPKLKVTLCLTLMCPTLVKCPNFNNLYLAKLNWKTRPSLQHQNHYISNNFRVMFVIRECSFYNFFVYFLRQVVHKNISQGCN